MKQNKLKCRLFIWLVAGSVVAATYISCNKNYFDNTGLNVAQYNGTILQYLNSDTAYFDSLVRVIHLAGMDNVFSDSTITFFAPPKQCIQASVQLLNSYLYMRGRDTVTDLSQIDPSVWREFLSMYILPGKYVQKDFPQLDTTVLATYPGQGYISWGGAPMNVGVIYEDAGGVKYAGLRKLCYSYITNPTNPTTGMINQIVASSDIQPSNGAVHVLRLHNYYFGFDPNNFILEATGKGIATD